MLSTGVAPLNPHSLPLVDEEPEAWSLAWNRGPGFTSMYISQAELGFAVVTNIPQISVGLHSRSLFFMYAKSCVGL